MDEVWTIKAILDWAQRYLRDKGSESPRLDAELLLGFVLDCKRIDLYLRFDQPISEIEKKQFGQLFRRRVSGEPIAYILGFKEFMGLRLRVNSHVLIPRPDTEILVEKASERIASHGWGRVLDVGTGSAAIAVSLAVQHPHLQVEAWDISEEALNVARENALSHGVSDRVRFSLRDALCEQSWETCAGFDMIVSNPPYIRWDEKPLLPKSVREFEPEKALFANDHGLAFYKCFAKVAHRVLNQNGILLMEIGHEQAQDVKSVFSIAPWGGLVCHQDYGRRDRVCEVRYAEMGKFE